MTEFIVSINRTGEDYNTPALAEDALDLAGDLTDGTVKCGGYDNCSGTCDSSAITDGETVTWDAGSSSGTMIHITSTQYMIDVTTGTLADNDTVDDGESNTFDIMGAPDSCIAVMELYDDDSATLTGNVTIDGFTTDATNYVIFRTPIAERHDGTDATGAGINNTANFQNTITVSDPFTEITGLRISNQSASGTQAVIRMNQRAEINYNVVHDSEGGGIVRGIWQAAGTGTTNVYNNIVHNILDDCIVFSIFAAFTYNVYNNTVHTCGDVGIDDDGSGTMNVVNNISDTNVTSDYGGTFDTDTNNLDTTDGTVFENEAGDVFKLGSSDTAATDQGTTDPGSGLFSDDILGTTRPEGSAWDIGAHEIVSAAAVTHHQIMILQ